MNKDLLYCIAKEIKDLYENMSFNDIENLDNAHNINKLKELLLIEKDYYDNLTFEETIMFYDDFIKMKNNAVIGRILNKLNDLLDDKYFDNSLESESQLNNVLFGDIYRSLVDTGVLKKSVACKKYILRDVRILSLYMLKEMEKDGYINKEFYIGKEFCEIYRKSQFYILSFFYSDLEKEFIDNNFNINSFNLISNLSYQLQQLPYYFYKIAKEDVLNEELSVIVNDFNKLDNDSLADDDGVIRILYIVAMIKSLVVVDEDVIKILISKLDVNEKNGLIFDIIVDNLKNIRMERKNIKYLSLKKNNKYC